MSINVTGKTYTGEKIKGDIIDTFENLEFDAVREVLLNDPDVYYDPDEEKIISHWAIYAGKSSRKIHISEFIDPEELI